MTDGAGSLDHRAVFGPDSLLINEILYFHMTRTMGPVESWLRFLAIGGVTVVLGVMLIWMFVVDLGAEWWWAVIIIALFGSMVVVAYERLIGW